MCGLRRSDLRMYPYLCKFLYKFYTQSAGGIFYILLGLVKISVEFAMGNIGCIVSKGQRFKTPKLYVLYLSLVLNVSNEILV